MNEAGDEAADLSVIVMAGGAGTRFWPVSTEARPKQFLALLSERSLLQESVDRVRGLVPPERIFVLTSRRFVPLVAEQLPELPRENIVGEPRRRDTAAAVALGVLLIERRHGGGVITVLTSDHRIEPTERFRADLLAAAAGARANPASLYTFGVPPTYASTAYGYLHRGTALPGTDARHYALRSFEEKPPAPVAERYLTSGEHYWNSGMFVWTAGAVLAELERQLPSQVARLRRAVDAEGEPGFDAALAAAFDEIDPISIDFGVMEGARDVRCVEASFEWSDVGGWRALEPFLDSDGAGNAVRASVHTLDAHDNTVFAEDPDEEIALVGVEGLVVVRSGRRTLVCRREDAEEVKKLVASLPERLR